MENKKRLFQLVGVWPMLTIIVIVLGGSAIMSEKGMLNDNQILIIINVGLFAALFNLFFWLWKLKPYDESCKCKAVNEDLNARTTRNDTSLGEGGLDYAEFEAWLDNALSRKIPKDVVAFNFNLYEDADNHWSIELVGTTKTEKEDDDWACFESSFTTREAPFIWEGEADWRFLQETMLAITTYLEYGKYGDKLKAYRTVGVGFVQGDITILHKGTAKTRKSAGNILTNKYFLFFVVFCVVMVLLYFLPNGKLKTSLVYAFLAGISVFCALDTKRGKKGTRKFNELRNSMEGLQVEDSQKGAELKREMRERVNPLIQGAILYLLKPKSLMPLPVGCSKFGGLPDVPEGFEWPRDDNGFPLSMLLQIDCADLVLYDSEHIFPTSGHLYFFYELKKQDWDGMHNGVRVIYNDEPVEALHQLSRPEELSALDAEFRLDERAVQFSSTATIPSYEDLKVLQFEMAKDFDGTLYDSLREKSLSAYAFHNTGVIGSLSGYADVLQTSMLGGEYPEDDILLMQMFSFRGEDGNYDMTFGDLGNIYFYIKRDELARRDFSNVYFELQCD